MDEIYMGTEEPQTELETEPDALRDEPVGQTETAMLLWQKTMDPEAPPRLVSAWYAARRESGHSRRPSTTGSA
ncbi:MAG: hypothetical protein ACLUGW_07895 [Oscillospiraceae bacterium]